MSATKRPPTRGLRLNLLIGLFVVMPLKCGKRLAKRVFSGANGNPHRLNALWLMIATDGSPILVQAF